MKKVKYQVVFNPYDRTIYVLFKDKLSYYQFESLDECFGVDNEKYKKVDFLVKKDIWLDTHLHYESELTLSLVVRIGEEEYGDSLFYWTHGKKLKNVHIVHNDEQMLKKVNEIIALHKPDYQIGGLGFDVYL